VGGEEGLNASTEPGPPGGRRESNVPVRRGNNWEWGLVEASLSKKELGP